MVKSHIAKHGYTLVEAMIALGVMSLLSLGMMDLFIGSLRLATRSNAEISATLDASRAIHQIIDQSRQSCDAYLPDDSIDTLTSPTTASTANDCFLDGIYYYIGSSYTSASNWECTDTTGDANNGQVVDTAVLLVQPAAASSITVGGNTTSQSYPAASSTTPLYNRGGQSGPILIYRADLGGAPDGQNGRYLYETAPGGGLSTATEIIQLSDTPNVAPPWDAVQFDRPETNLGASFTQGREFEVKITSSYYSPINGQQTSDSTSTLTNTSLSGKCIYMRDFYTGPPQSPTNTNSFGNKFRWSFY